MDYSFIEKTENGNAGSVEVKPMATFANPFDLESVKAQFQKFESRINEMAGQIKAADLKTETDAAAFTDTIGRAKSLINGFEKKRKEISGDAYNFYKDCLGFEKYYSKMVKDKIIDPAESKLSFYFKQIEIERKKAEKAAQAAIEEKQKQLDEIADSAGVDRVKLDAQTFKNEKPKIAGEAATATPKDKWIYEVENISKVPIEYLMIDDKAVNRAIKNGERKIPGLAIKKEVKAQVRARR
jgi:hypothetical protein